MGTSLQTDTSSHQAAGMYSNSENIQKQKTERVFFAKFVMCIKFYTKIDVYKFDTK